MGTMQTRNDDVRSGDNHVVSLSFDAVEECVGLGLERQAEPTTSRVLCQLGVRCHEAHA